MRFDVNNYITNLQKMQLRYFNDSWLLRPQLEHITQTDEGKKGFGFNTKGFKGYVMHVAKSTTQQNNDLSVYRHDLRKTFM